MSDTRPFRMFVAGLPAVMAVAGGFWWYRVSNAKPISNSPQTQRPTVRRAVPPVVQAVAERQPVAREEASVGIDSRRNRRRTKLKAAIVALKPTRANRDKKPTPHNSVDRVLAHLLQRLHQEALLHFLSDPRLGGARMPVVRRKVLRKWETPHFTSGELRSGESLPFENDLKRIHKSSVKDFELRPKNAVPLKASRRNNVILRSLRAARGKKFNPKKTLWEARSVDLIGLLMHEQPTVYVSREPGKAARKPAESAATRSLDDFELSGLTALESGRHLYARSKNDVVRMLGSVRARKSCLSCHTEKKEGDLLGAFSYTLRQARFKK